MRGIAAYKNVSLESSDQRKLVVMCFEALIRRHKQAKAAQNAGKYVKAAEDLRVAREIYCELLVGLDHDAAPEMTTNLAGLYHYCIRELTQEEMHARKQSNPYWRPRWWNPVNPC